MFLKYVLISMRPRQWTKNLLVFAALIFSKNVFHVPLLLTTLGAVFLFCLASGAIYLLNDVLDRESDKAHPGKRTRPLPSGKLSASTAIACAALLGAAALIPSFVLAIKLGVALAVYMALAALYCVALKHVVIVDILAVAMGFVLRAVGGAYAIDVEISVWLLVCTLLLALFLALSKRRGELTNRGNSGTRKVLAEYSPELLDQMISVVTAATVMAYTLYTIDERTYHVFGTRNLIYTVPFVIYGIFRYLYLIHKAGRGEDPEVILVTDKGILLGLVLWLGTAALIVYAG